MALVYSQQRAGKPRLAILGAFVLLCLTVALAYAVILHKERLYSVPLGPEKAYPMGQLRARLPSGWEKLDLSELPEGTLAAVESTSEHYAEQSLYLFRGVSVDYPPRKRALLVLGRFAREAFPEYEVHADSMTPCRFGPFPAWSGLFWFASKESEIFADVFPEDFMVGRVVSLSNGETVGLALRSNVFPRRRDEALLDELADSVRMLGVEFADQPESVQAQAGIRFSLPSGGRLLALPEDGPPQLRLMVGEGTSYWDATLTRIPLVNGRTPEQIVTDVLLESTLKSEPPETIAFLEGGSRRVAHVGIPGILDETVQSQHCYCAPIDAQTALLIKATGEEGAIERMTRACDRIATEAEVEPITTWLDVAAAQDQAAKWLRHVELAGLDTYLAEKVSMDPVVYSSYDPGRILRGIMVYDYRSSEQDERWWEVDCSFSIDLRLTHHETTLIRNDGRAHREELKIENEDIHLSYEELRSDGKELERKLTIEGEHFKERFEPSENYMNLALMELLLAEIARDEEGEPALFMSTTALSRGEHAWIVRPLGRREVPWPGSRVASTEALAVRVFQDYDPEYYDAYYDTDGRFLGTMFSDGHWYEEGRPTLKYGGNFFKNVKSFLLNTKDE